MKFIKKITLFVALALVVTIGGVYAAWVYPSSTAGIGSADKTYTSDMFSVETSGVSNGTIHVDSASDNFAIKIDDARNHGGANYLAMPIASGDFSFYFTPEEGAAAEYMDGIDLVVDISVSSGTKVKNDAGTDVSIFTVKTATINISESDLTENGGSFWYTLTAADVLECLNFCEGTAVTLETHAENVIFDEALGTYGFTFTISEA